MRVGGWGLSFAVFAEELIEFVVDLVGFRGGILPPFGGPDADDFPAEVSEDLFADDIAVAGGR